MAKSPGSAREAPPTDDIDALVKGYVSYTESGPGDVAPGQLIR